MSPDINADRQLISKLEDKKNLACPKPGSLDDKFTSHDWYKRYKEKGWMENVCFNSDMAGYRDKLAELYEGCVQARIDQADNFLSPDYTNTENLYEKHDGAIAKMRRFAEDCRNGSPSTEPDIPDKKVLEEKVLENEQFKQDILSDEPDYDKIEYDDHNWELLNTFMEAVDVGGKFGILNKNKYNIHIIKLAIFKLVESEFDIFNTNFIEEMNNVLADLWSKGPKIYRDILYNLVEEEIEDDDRQPIDHAILDSINRIKSSDEEQAEGKKLKNIYSFN